MNKIYKFKITLKSRRVWVVIEILGNQVLGEFDLMIRETFHYDCHDHLSAFYKGKIRNAQCYGEIEPNGGGQGSKVQIHNLGVKIGDQLTYVYDFGACIISSLELLEITEPEPNVLYPRIESKSKKRTKYCDRCKLQGKKTIARQIAYYEEGFLQEYLCDICVDDIPEDAVIDEIMN
jgi:predicted RNase H-like nuclease